MKVSAVIPTFNSGELLDRCLDALAAADAVDDINVLDGGSSDGTYEHAARRPGIHAIRMEGTNVGQRLNQGVAQARHELVLLLNDDAFVDPDTPGRLAEVMVERPRVAVVGARLRYEDGRPQRSAGRYKTLADVTLTTLHLHRVAAPLRAAPVQPIPGTGLLRATWTPLCAGLVRKSAFQSVGGFDERFSFYSDDQDFARRLTRAGWETVVRADAGAVHIGGASTRGKEAAPWRLRYYQSRFLYLQKHYPRAWRVYAVLWAVRASLHVAVWRIRAMRHRLRSDEAGERGALAWADVYRRSRRPAQSLRRP